MTSGDSFAQQIRDHLANPPRPGAEITAESLDRDHEARSADGNVAVVVAGKSLQITSVTVRRVDERTGRAVVEAVNAALASAESGGEANDLDRAMADRVAELDRAMDRMTERVETLGSRLDSLLAQIEPPTQARGSRPT